MKYKAKLILMLTLMVAIIITHSACGKKEPFTQTDFCLDTSCQITIYDDDIKEGTAERIAKDAFQVIHRYEKLLSKTVSGSDIDRINESGGQPVEVSDETIAVIGMANEISKKSGGAFDITIGAVNELWDFRGENPQVPDAAAIAEALPGVGYEAVAVDGNTVTLTNPSAQLDLGGIAKGYIADKTAEFLEEKGIEKAVINLGGNVVVLGEKDENTPWVIGIERPFSNRTELVGSIEVTDATVVTSGIYERNFEENGVLYHHILDPETGYPAETDLEAVTITANKGQSGFCDAVSTACLLLGKERALALIEQLQREYPDIGLEAALIDKNDKITQTDGMKIQFSEKK